MELEDIFVKIQGLLDSLDKTVGPLSKLKARGGNEQNILTVVSQLNKLLVQNNYLNKKQEHLNDNMLRKITFFLILNSDLSDEENLKNEPTVGHLVTICPKLSPCLVLDCIWGLNLDCYLGEILTYGPATLTLELLKSIVISIRFSLPYPLLSRLRMLIYAIYTKICQLQNDRIYFYKLEYLLSDLFQKAVELLQQYINPNFLKIDDWTESEMYRYTGYTMESIFKLSNDCFNVFINKSPIFNYKYNLYNIEYKIGAEFHPPIGQRKEKIFKILSEINTCLLQCCVGNLKAISVEIYCSWAEFKLDNNKTLQQVIGNCAYEINEKLSMLNLDSDFISELSGMFSSIAIKPLDLNEEINEADIDTVIKNIQVKDNSNRKLWFKRFLTFKNIFTDLKCLSLLGENLDLCDAEDVSLLLQLIYDQKDKKNKHFEAVKEVGIKSLESLDVADQITVIESYFKINGINSVFERPYFNKCLTETFNKIVSADILNSVPELMLQNPKAVLRLIFEDTFKSKSKTDLMIPLIKSFKRLCDIPIVNNEETTDNKTIGINLLELTCDQFSCSAMGIEPFVYALENIVNNDIIFPSCIAENIIFPQIHKSMNEKKYKNALFWLEGCKTICLHENFSSLYMTFLLFLAQILKHCRTEINNFSMDKISVLEITIQIIEVIVKKIADEKLFKEEDSKYLKSQWLEKEPIQNRYYFELLWNNQNSTLLKYLFGSLSDHTRTWNISRFLEFLPFLTLDEWKSLSGDILKERPDALEYFQMLIDFLNLLISVVKQSKTQRTLSCLEYCLKNFMIIMNDIICPKIDSYNAQLVVWETIFYLIKILPEEIKENCCLKLIKILMPILQNLKEKNVDVYGIIALDLTLVENIDICQLICKKVLEQ